MARIHEEKAGKHIVASADEKAERNRMFFAYAGELRDVAVNATEDSPMVRLFLLGQAIELYLKAFLLSGGYGEERLDKLGKRPCAKGHDLRQLLDESLAHDLGAHVAVPEDVREAVEALNALYCKEALQYFAQPYHVTGVDLPDSEHVSDLFKFAEDLEGFLDRQLPLIH